MSAPAFPVSKLHASGLESSLDPEWQFLRIAVSEPSDQTLDQLRSLCPRVRWRVLFDLAERHGVLPLLYQMLSHSERLISGKEMRLLAQLYQTNLHKTMLVARELIHVTGHLQDEGIDVLPYKGLALAEAVYKDIALRQSGDIDLLIHARDLPRIRQALRELGYVPHSSLSPAQEKASLRVGYECGFDGPAGRNLLEVQWAIQPRFYAVDFDQDELFDRAVPVKLAGHEIRTPSPEDLFLILSVHAAKHVWGRLIWLCDLARIMQLPKLNWDAIAARAQNSGIVRILRVTLLLVSRVLNTDIPKGAENSLPPDPEGGSLAAEIETHIASATEYDVESVDYFHLMLRLRENWRDRMRFIGRLILTPGPGEWAAVHLPESLFPLYRVVRFWRLAGKLASR